MKRTGRKISVRGGTGAERMRQKERVKKMKTYSEFLSELTMGSKDEEK